MTQAELTDTVHGHMGISICRESIQAIFNLCIVVTLVVLYETVVYLLIECNSSDKLMTIF